MTAEIKFNPSARVTASPYHPDVDLSEESFRIGGLPILRHFFEPDKFSGSPLAAKDRGTGGHPVATPSTGVTAAASAAYGNRTVITKAAAHAAFAYDAGSAPESFTMLMACDAAAAGGSLWAFYNGSISSATVKYALSWRSDVGRLQFAENYAANTSPLLLPVADMPALSTPFVLAVTYDRATRKSCMFVNSADVKATIIHTGTLPVIDTATRVAIGGLYQFGSANWNGRIGRAILIDRAYHDPAYLPLLDREIAAMRAYYGI